MLKVYIAGKIDGDKNYKEKFKKAEASLSKEGYAVLNPAVLPEGMSSEDYMTICFSMLSRADAVYFLEDYKESKGAGIEYNYCTYCGKTVFFEEHETAIGGER